MTLAVFGRFVTAMFALAFAFVNVSPAFESPCPVHDPAFAMLASGQHHVHSVAHSGASKSTHGRGEHGRNCCKCIGCASCVAPYTLALPSLAFVPAEIRVASDVPLLSHSAYTPRFAEHALPYPTAPPQALSV